MRQPNVDELREHLAYEVHYLVLATHRFPQIEGREAAIYQDSVFLHSRNLLEFTKPRKPRFGLWIKDVGGAEPTAEQVYGEWVDFINANASHLGKDRFEGIQRPHTQVDPLARYALGRILRCLPQATSDIRILVISTLATLGLEYLDTGDESTLSRIADALDHPLPTLKQP